LRLPHGDGLAQLTPRAGHVECALRLSEMRDLGAAVERCRALFDLDADPQAVDAVLGADPVLGSLVAGAPGRRVPGAADGTELAVRAVIGQQVSVASARIVVSAATDRDELRERLLEIPGIGEWTVAYVLMRLGDTDAFPATDHGVRRALEALDRPADAAAAARLAEAWRPWRAYAVQHLWDVKPTSDACPSRHTTSNAASGNALKQAERLRTRAAGAKADVRPSRNDRRETETL
jgi:AraC family transcriptional regulator of adaptative response / DNA-3-methyladenine glycosylase II